MTLDRDQLRHAAGDFTAGDLDRTEAEAFRRLLAEDPTLERECRFWERVRGTMCPPPGAARTRTADPAAPGEHFAAALLQRAARERTADRRVVLRMPAWATAATAAAAAAVLVALLMGRGAGSSLPMSGRMYQEDGTAVIPQMTWDDYMPLAQVSRIEPTSAVATVAHERQRPWLGMWTRPVTLVDGDSEDAAHLVLRVAGGSPAHAMGLSPGDVVRSLDGCRVTTERCIARKLAACRPGDTLRVEWIRPSTGERFAKELRAETVYE